MTNSEYLKESVAKLSRGCTCETCHSYHSSVSSLPFQVGFGGRFELARGSSELD